MLAALLVTTALAEAPVDAASCPARLAALLDRPAAVFASGREAATRALGEPNLEAVEVLAETQGERHLTVRFRLFFDQARASFAQPAAGGAERLEELDLFTPLDALPLPAPFGATEPELLARMGEPSRIELPGPFERRLIYECERGRRPESVSFRFADGALTGAEWRLTGD
jgi:hypothetical protein